MRPVSVIAPPSIFRVRQGRGFVLHACAEHLQPGHTAIDRRRRLQTSATPSTALHDMTVLPVSASCPKPAAVALPVLT